VVQLGENVAEQRLNYEMKSNSSSAKSGKLGAAPFQRLVAIFHVCGRLAAHIEDFITARARFAFVPRCKRTCCVCYVVQYTI
jgi:hypothetical protein